MKYGLSDTVINRIQSVLIQYPQVDKAILYGSRAKGNYRNGSDIDLTLEGGEDLSLSILGRIMDDIDDLLLAYSFDISIKSQITDPEVLEHINTLGVGFYEKE